MSQKLSGRFQFTSESIYEMCMLTHAVGLYFRYAPQCISDVVAPVSALSSRDNLRSAADFNYDIQRTRSNIGRSAFSVACPVAWNGLPRSRKETRCFITALHGYAKQCCMGRSTKYKKLDEVIPGGDYQIVAYSRQPTSPDRPDSPESLICRISSLRLRSIKMFAPR